MTHCIIQKMLDAVASEDNQDCRKLIEITRGMDCAKFVVDGLDLQLLNAGIYQEFGIELLRHGLAIPPANFTYFQFDTDMNHHRKIMEKLASRMDTEGDRRTADLLRSDLLAQKQETFGVFVAVTGNVTPSSCPCLIVEARRHGDEVTVGGRGECDLMSTEAVDAFLPLADDSFDTPVLASLLLNYLTHIGLLSSKFTKRHEHAPKPSANKKRVASGKPPLPSYIALRLDFSEMESEAKQYSGGTRESPRPHFRRGHVRTLSDGRKVVVSPAWVLADPANLPSLPEYTIKH